MKQTLLKKLWLRVLILVAIMTTALAGTAWADDEVYYTLNGRETGGSNGYNTVSEITQTYEGRTYAWSVVGNTTVNPWRIGGKNLYEEDRAVTSSSALSEDITKVVVSNGTATATVNRMTLIVAVDGDFDNPISIVEGNWNASDLTIFERPEGADWSNKYFRLVYNITAGSSNQYAQLESMEFYYSPSGVETVATPTFSPAAGTYTEPQYVTLTSATGSATIYYTTDGTEPTPNSNVYEDPIYVEETTTIKAIAYCDGMDASSVATATYTIQSVELDHAGTEGDPYSVADARTAIDAGVGTQGVYVTGTVTEIVTEWSEQYGNISFNFVDEEGDNNFLQAYRCVSTEAADASTVQVGDIVVVYGNLTYYASKQLYEFEAACQLVSLTHPGTAVEPVIIAEDATIDADVTYYELMFSIENPLLGAGLTATTTASWITSCTPSTKSFDRVMIECTANETTEDRTATIVLTYGTSVKEVNLTQKGIVAPVSEFATLPFEFNGGVADIEGTAGLTEEGIDKKDYAEPPYLKFNTTGDYLILAFDERPGVLSFDIRGYEFSGGTFTVQTSEDGENYTDLKAYTALGTKQSEEFKNLGEGVRYIKWIYTEKVSGNVGLGNIKLEAYSEIPSIAVTPSEINATAEGEEGILTITAENITLTPNDQLYILFRGADGGPLDAQPDWITTDITIGEAGFVINYTIAANQGGARSAFFEVEVPAYNLISNAVIVNQEAYIEPAVPGNWVETSLTDITPNDVFVIVADNGNTFAMSNDKGTQAGPDAVAVTVTEGTLSGDVPANIQWQLSVGEEGYTFYPYGDAESWLYCTNTNNGVRVGTNANKVFTSDAASGYLVNTTTGRYMGVYNSQDWRCYTSISTNIQNQTFKFYKKVDTPQPASQTVAVSAAGYATFVAEANLVIPADVEVFSVEVSDGYAYLNPIIDNISAGEAVLIRADEGEYSFLHTSDNVRPVSYNDLRAATQSVTADGSQYILANGTQGIGFYRATVGTIIEQGKAYLYLPNGVGVKVFYGFEEDSATGISELNDLKDSKDIIYNVAGQRLQKMQRGINITGGKKVLIK